MFRRIVIALLLLSSSFAAAQQWTEVRSPHYTVISDGGAQQARDLALRFEQMRSAFGSLANTGKVHLPVPLDIVAFRSSQEYQGFAPRTVGAAFEAGEDRSYALLDLSAAGKWQPVFTEYVRQMVNGTLPPDSKLDAQQLESQLLSGQTQPAVVDPTKFSSKALDPAEVRVRLAALRIAAQDLGNKTVQEFADILKTTPNDAAAHRELGYLHFLRGEFDTAAAELARALTLAPKDPWSNYYAGLLAVRQSLAAGRPPANPAALQQQLRIATSIPDLADAFSLLSFADAVRGDKDAAVSDARRASEMSPRNQTYSLNLARAYLAAGKAIEARDIFRTLKDSKNPDMAATAQQGLARAERIADNQSAAARHVIPETYDKPQWHRSEEEIEREPEKPVAKPPDTRPVKYVQGELLSVDCSQPPAAIVRIKAGPRTLRLLTSDSGKLLLIGADQFSCSWKNRKVLINYKAGGKTDGDLVSLELQ